MPRIRRLNMDTSWHIEWAGTGLVLDPWLVGSEVDGFSWFNEQWHTTDPVAPNALPAHDAIIVSQSYADHCHLETLDQFSPDIPVLCVPKSQSKLQKRYPDRSLPCISTEPIAVGDLEVESLHPNRRLDPIYYAIVIRRGRQAIFYCPHGFDLHPEAAERVAGLDVLALVTTFTDFQLPSWLGGHVNPGLDNVRRLVTQLRPKVVLNCHDEDKRARGLVMRLAKVERADLARLQFDGTTFVPTPDYAPIEV